METTHQALAEELGSVREVVSRILKDFEGQGILELERGQIRVVDEEALQRIARPSVPLIRTLKFFNPLERAPS